MKCKKIIQFFLLLGFLNLVLFAGAKGFAFGISQDGIYLVVTNGKIVVKISKENGMISSLKLKGKSFEIGSDFAHYSVFFPEFSYLHPDGIGMDYYEPEKDKRNVNVTYKKYNKLIIVQAVWENGKIDAVWEYFFEPNIPYFRVQITRTVARTGVYSNFQQCTMYNPDMDNSFIINYQGELEVTMGHYHGNKKCVAPIKWPVYYSPFTAQHSLWTVFDYGRPTYFPAMIWSDNETNIHAGVIATYTSPNQRETISYHGGGTTKSHPGFCEAQFNWFGKSDSESLYLRKGTQFSMELYFYQNIGPIDSLLDFSQNLLSQNFVCKMPENYVAASWGGNNSSREIYYWRFPQVSSNYITSQELWRHKSFSIPRSQNGIWDIPLFSLDVIHLDKKAKILTPNHGTDPLFEKLWTLKTDTSYTGGMSWKVDDFYTKLSYTNYSRRRRVTVAGEINNRNPEKGENFIRLTPSSRIRQLFVNTNDTLFSFISMDPLLDTVSISLTNVTGIDSFFLVSDSLFLRIAGGETGASKFCFDLFPAIKNPIREKSRASQLDLAPPSPYKAYFVKMGMHSDLSYLPSSRYFAFDEMKKKDSYAFNLYVSSDVDSFIFALDDSEQYPSGSGSLRISEGLLSRIVYPIGANATIFRFHHQFRAHHIYHIEWLYDSYQVIPEEIKTPMIYPNPSKGDFSFFFNSAKGGECSYEIYNILGVKVFRLKENLESNEIIVKNFDLSHFPSGVYFLRIRQSTKSKSLKFVIVR